MLFYSKMTVFETLDSERRRKWRQDATKQIFCCLQLPGGGGGGTLLTAKYPAPGTHRASNARGLPGGMLAAGIDSHISLAISSAATFL